MSAEFTAVCEREGDLSFLDKVADERNAAKVDELLAWLRLHSHPALALTPILQAIAGPNFPEADGASTVGGEPGAGAFDRRRTMSSEGYRRKTLEIRQPVLTIR